MENYFRYHVGKATCVLGTGCCDYATASSSNKDLLLGEPVEGTDALGDPTGVYIHLNRVAGYGLKSKCWYPQTIWGTAAASPCAQPAP